MSNIKDEFNKYGRRSIRLPEYDYSCAGEYFVTICVHGRECLLGDIENECMVLNDYGHCVDCYWKELPSHYNHLHLGEWVVMPNHVHGILNITDGADVGAIHESPMKELPLITKRRKMLLSKIIGRFKMNTGKQINIMRNTPGAPLWQRNYYEHIIRDAKSYTEIENYIRNNPLNWLRDQHNPVNIKISNVMDNSKTNNSW